MDFAEPVAPLAEAPLASVRHEDDVSHENIPLETPDEFSSLDEAAREREPAAAAVAGNHAASNYQPPLQIPVPASLAPVPATAAVPTAEFAAL